VSFKDFLLYLIFVILVIFTLSRSAYSQEPIPAKQVIRAIIGEASGEGEFGMYAVATAILNRNTLSGVYGLNSPHIDKEPTWVWLQAEKALKRAKEAQIKGIPLHQGDYWGSTICDKAWIAKMEKAGFVKVYEYKNHKFYRRAE